MKNLLVLVFITFYTFINLTFAAQERNILWKEFNEKSKSLSDVSVWRNKLKQDVQNNLNKLTEDIKKELIERADNETKSSWPSLLAMDFLEFVIDGNRDHFEGHRAKRRQKLVNLIIGELLTEKGKYMNHIADGVWLILEESTWTWPAHLYMQKSGTGLPDPTEFIIDLGVGEASSHMAWIKLLMGNYLSKISFMIRYSEINLNKIEINFYNIKIRFLVITFMNF